MPILLPIRPCRDFHRKMLALFLLGVFASTASHGANIERYEGIAYDAKGRELYRESHWLTGDYGSRELVVLFQCPDSKAFARKHVRETGKPEAPSFELEDGRVGYREGVRTRMDAHREVFVQRSSNQAEQHAPLVEKPGLVLDAGFDTFIRNRWDALGTRKQNLDFLVPSRLGTVPFAVRQLDDGTLDGRPTRRFRLELNAWYSFAIPSIDVAYDRTTRALREYRGIANIRDSAGKNLTVRIDFPPEARTGNADRRSLDSANAAKLDGTCKL